jgi:NADH:ubiquinone oxidoreductase subunit 5 (subunit L)/multisubunit Na+/H+ antiporter MnhA subunit
MSLTSWALVVAHHRERDNLQAGYIYLLMAGFGTLALLLAFGLLAGNNGNYLFDSIRVAQPIDAVAAIVLVLALVGAGSKAGIVPLHAWLPLAHPAAPSHVSALMSGVMTKVAVYGFVRIAFDLLGPPAWWWSMLVLAIGGATAVMGVLYALMEHDLKRLLAYHTVENIGIFLILGLRSHSRCTDGRCGGAGSDRRAAARIQSFSLQESSVLRRWRGAQCNRRTRHGASRRSDPPYATDRVRVSCRMCCHFGASAAERLCIGMADVPGHSA